ncbi:hypothetical protein BLNAU_11100 [Blattamonas nauphoetae]|uniref:Uncharacterized protein n=1 Tax=Blattamonas nauphoetae TaxID=2049346 RepID=A0ABQ9XNL4_9EUKA|nr:hypothetical protein BLNAU_11100 [Blattamonas nauphoetae]
MAVFNPFSTATHTLPLPSASPSPPTLLPPSPSPTLPLPLPLPHHPHPPTPLCLSLTTHTLSLPSATPSPPTLSQAHPLRLILLFPLVVHAALDSLSFKENDGKAKGSLDMAGWWTSWTDLRVVDGRERRTKSVENRAKSEKRHDFPPAHLSACLRNAMRSLASHLVALADSTAIDHPLSTIVHQTQP